MLYEASNKISMRFVMQSLRFFISIRRDYVCMLISNNNKYNLSTTARLFPTTTQRLSPSVYNGSALPSVQRFLNLGPCRAPGESSAVDAHTNRNLRKPCQRNADVLGDTEDICKKRATTRRRYAPKKPRTRWRSVKALRLQMH